jgi:hypothetical protein
VSLIAAAALFRLGALTVLNQVLTIAVVALVIAVAVLALALVAVVAHMLLRRFRRT